MKINPLYIAMVLLLVSVVFATGAMADDASPVMKPLLSSKSVVSGSYAEIAVEETEAICIPDMGYGSLQVDPSYAYLQLQPGETVSSSVIIINRGDEDITIDPVMILQPYSENYLEEEWVTVIPSNVVIQADEKREFTVEVSMPEDADLGYYNANIVFDRSVIVKDTGYMGADSKLSSIYYGNSLDLSVEVWIPPTIQVSSNYINDRVEAGKEYEYEIKLVNTGDEDISIDPGLLISEFSPEIMFADSYYGAARSFYGGTLSDDSLSIDAPSDVKAGGTAVVKFFLKTPDDLQGSFSATVDLGIDDPALNEWEQQVNLYFNVWQQPSEPFVTEFTSHSDAPVRIELSANQYDYLDYSSSSVNSKEQPEFYPVLKKDGVEVELHLVKTERKGSVNFGSNDGILYSSSRPLYQQYSITYTEVYEAVGAAGNWELSILSANTDNFDYSISIDDSE